MYHLFICILLLFNFCITVLLYWIVEELQTKVAELSGTVDVYPSIHPSPELFFKFSFKSPYLVVKFFQIKIADQSLEAWTLAYNPRPQKNDNDNFPDDANPILDDRDPYDKLYLRGMDKQTSIRKCFKSLHDYVIVT
ncbi:hypothetical protein BpHYR1_049531 [Brachionus plicatilis]|uniref:Uncharacterized protein n=1 Tax=Brachionus plicatilis TaxID=10195 RepID=A0A3M7QR60_BRAPC|nr:hypothetical protein BpHYR1_049531 [Brachionus plicatilis]